MIQSLNIKNIEPKATPKAKGAVAGEVKTSKARELDSSKSKSAVKDDEFANELANVSEESEPKVKPVKVSSEQVMEAPSKLIKLPEAGPDAVNPQVFDPALTQSVDSIVEPKTTEVPVELTAEEALKLAQAKPVLVEGMPVVDGAAVETELDAEIAQAMLKTPQVQEGTPAVAKGEVNSSLMNMEDFVSQKNSSAKKNLNNGSAYGMPNKAVGQKAAAIENDLKSTQTINELGAKSSEAGSSTNSQQFILSAQADLSSNAKANETQAPVKVLNMSDVKTDNPDKIMTQITDYIVQAKAAKEPTVTMRVNHEELGMIDIRVQKSGVGQDTIAVSIGTHSVDGKNFFQANSKDLFSHLTSTGLNVTDLKVETPAQTAKSDFDFGSQSGRGGHAGAEKQFGSEQGQKKHDSDRRQDLWNLLRDNKEAA